MKCPFCGFLESKVVDSRPAEEGGSIRRRRECLKCAKRFTTYETIESLPLLVVKKDGVRQSFLENLAAEVEQTLQNEMEREVPSSRISEMVTARLRDIDEVAYVRFASVTRHFADVETFLSEINSLMREKDKT
jgi:transcriptional repressor NrdR